jgi:hypothetical protein
MAKGSNQKLTLKKNAMIQALESSLGIVSKACETIGISRKTHYDWIKDDPEYAKAVDELSNLVLDFAESNLHKQIEEGNSTSTIYLLNHKGKSRGYNNDVEHKPDEVTHDLSKLTPAELKKFTALMAKVSDE